MFKFVKILVVLATVALAAPPMAMAEKATDGAGARAGASVRITSPAARMIPTHAAGDVQYTKEQKEFYMTDEEKDWARPGMTVEIVGRRDSG